MKPGFYRLSEDTLLLIEAVSRCQGDAALEIGAGGGYVTAELAKGYCSVVGTDIDVDALRVAKSKLRLDGVHERVDLVCCDGAAPFKAGVFDLVAYNPPYLESQDMQDVAVDGGMEGLEVAEKWFMQARGVVKSSGIILFITSSASNHGKLLDRVASEGFALRILESRKLFFEELLAVEVRKA